jgi:hypothetical protein
MHEVCWLAISVLAMRGHALKEVRLMGGIEKHVQISALTKKKCGFPLYGTSS